jgi:hypothetical protein
MLESHVIAAYKEELENAANEAVEAEAVEETV